MPMRISPSIFIKNMLEFVNIYKSVPSLLFPRWFSLIVFLHDWENKVHRQYGILNFNVSSTQGSGTSDMCHHKDEIYMSLQHPERPCNVFSDHYAISIPPYCHIWLERRVIAVFRLMFLSLKNLLTWTDINCCHLLGGYSAYSPGIYSDLVCLSSFNTI